MKKIIYPDGNGGIYIVIPTKEEYFDESCNVTVPMGLPYLLINDEDIPTDRTFRNAWEADFSNPDGYSLGLDKWLENKGSK